MNSKVIILIHDVAPCFRNEVEELIYNLEFLPKGFLSAAIVPNWHYKDEKWEESFIQLISDHFGELLLHGYSHKYEWRSNPFRNVLFNQHEFFGKTSDETLKIINEAEDFYLETFQKRPLGIVPPAWIKGTLDCSFTRSKYLQYTLGFKSLTKKNGLHQKLSTLSWDWGLPQSPGFLGNGINYFFSTFSKGIVQIVLHPKDVNGNLKKNALPKIKRLLDTGYIFTLPKDLLDETF